MFSTTIKQHWWDEKMKDYSDKGHFYEYKEDKAYWNKRLNRLKVPCNGVFLVGNKVHKVRVDEIHATKTEYIPEKYQSAISTKYCWWIKCTLK